MENHIYAGYFDYSAATPVDENVIEAMKPFFFESFYNPSAIYLKSRAVRAVQEEARHTVAKCFGARSSEVIFTAGGTEANNLAIRGIMNMHPKCNVVISTIEHDSVLKTAQNYSHRTASVNSKAVVDLSDLAKKIDDNTVLVSIMYANNEVGSIQPIKEIIAIINDIRQDRRERKVSLPIYFHTDACQAVNYLDISVARLGVDLMTVNSGKIYGPKQVGALYVKAGLVLKPIIYGGGQENGLRSGTENTAGIVGFSVALEKACHKHKSEAKKLTSIRDSAISRLTMKPSNITINGAKGLKRLANNIHLTVPGVDNEYLMMQLDEKGFQVAVGSACSASSGEPSHVLKAMGLTNEQAQSSLRITMGRYSDKVGLDSLLDNLLYLIK